MSYTYLKSLRPYFLVDHSQVYSNAGQLSHDTLGSVAFGVRFSDGRYYTLDLWLAKPVADIPANATSRSPRSIASCRAIFSYPTDVVLQMFEFDVASIVKLVKNISKEM